VYVPHMTTVVSVHSFRGGTGKSNTTSNVAANLAALGHRVGVIDCDIQSPGIHVLFGFDETLDRTLNDYLWGTRPIRDVAHDITDRVSMSTAVSPGGSLHLVPSSMKPGDIARILRDGYDVESLSDGMRQLARDLDLDFLFIDTHPGLNEETLLSITLSDVLLLILRPDRQDYQGTAVTVDVARRLEVPSLFLVANKVPSGLTDLRKQLDDAYGAETIAVLPLSEEVVVNASGGLFSLLHPEHPWSQQVRGIADRLHAGTPS
ncbi:MAG: MinD/ParA family ATP-binding protein, partial [Ilumatobacteraceae bacterium]